MLALPLLASVVLPSAPPARAQTGPACVQLASNAAYTQDFDSLAATGAGGQVPPGWAFVESDTNANASYTAGTGSSNSGDTYSFGVAGSSERAFGGLQSGSLVPTIGACAAAATVRPIGQVQGAVDAGANGDAHRSPFAPATGGSPGSEAVTVQGVLYQKTLARTSSGGTQNGFFLQNTAATDDGDPNTSDGIFVFLGNATTVRLRAGGAYTPTVGDEIVLTGRVSEFFNLTQLSTDLFVESVAGRGLAVDTAVPAFEANPPDDLAESRRYWERREGMRARVPTGSVVVGRRDVFGSTADAETWVIHPNHPVARRTGFDRRVFRDPHPLDNLNPPLFDDGNGYRIMLASLGIKAAADDPLALIAPTRTFQTLTNAPAGGVYYSFNKYGIQVGEQITLANGPDPSTNAPPTAPDRAREYSVATFNVANLYDRRDDPFDGCDFTGNSGCPGVRPPFDYVPASQEEYDARLNALAGQVVKDLKSPDVLLIQEAEDQDICAVTGGSLACGSMDNADGKPDTLQELALRIRSTGGPAYDAAFDRNGADDRGIVSAFLFRTDRVQLAPVDASHPVLGSSPSVAYRGAPLAYNADVQNPKSLNADLPADVDRSTGTDGSDVFTRAPQVGLFRIFREAVGQGQPLDVYLISNHFSSTPDARAGQRKEQAAYNAAIVAAIQGAGPQARVLVGGDFNVFPRPDDPFAPGDARGPKDQLGPLYDRGLDSLWDRLVAEVPAAAYSYVFQGQAQTLDSMFVTDPLLADLAQVRVAHINSDFPADFPGDDPRGASDHDPSVARFKFPEPSDTVAPTTTATTMPAAPDGQNGWFTGDVTVTLTAADNQGGSGVKEIVYSASGAQTIAQTVVPGATATIQSTGEGTTTITYFARDKVGNAEGPKTLTIKLDKTDPTIAACSLSPDTIWPPNKKLVQVKATVQARDGQSGPPAVTLTELTVAEGTVEATTRGWQIGTADFEGEVLADRAGNGNGQVYRFTYRATDQAGRTATCSAEVRVPHDRGRGNGR